jgi:hypothetical protein
LFAASPGLVFASPAAAEAVGTSNEGKLEREQRLAKLLTGSPSLTYVLEWVEAHDGEAVEFGLEVESGLVIRDGYEIGARETIVRRIRVELADGYYRFGVQALPTLHHAEMRLRVSATPSRSRVDGSGASVDFIPLEA